MGFEIWASKLAVLVFKWVALDVDPTPSTSENMNLEEGFLFENELRLRRFTGLPY